MRTYFNLDTDRTIRVRDMDATPGTENTWSVGQDCGEEQQIHRTSSRTLVQMGVHRDRIYLFQLRFRLPSETTVLWQMMMLIV